MPLKPDKYRHHFDGFDLSEAQKTAMCEAICTIAEAFADLAFHVSGSSRLDTANDNDSVNESNVIRLPEQPKTIETEGQSGPRPVPTPAKRRA